MKRLIQLALLLCIMAGVRQQDATGAPLGKDSINTYEQLEAKAAAEAERLKKDHGLMIRLAMNPQYLSTADAATLNGVAEWIKTIAAAVGMLAKQKGKLAEIQEKAGMIVIMPFKDEGLTNQIDRVRGGLTIIQDLSALSKAPPANFSEQLRQAIFEPTPREKLDTSLAELAPLRGKITTPLSSTQISQLALLSVNIAMIKAGRLMLVMQELDESFQAGISKPLAKLAKENPKLLDQKTRAAIANLPKELVTDFKRMQKGNYAGPSALQVKVKSLLTDSLIKDGLELAASRPTGLPDLSSRLTNEELWKGILFYIQDWDGLPDAAYFHRLSNWGDLMPLEKP